MSDVIHIDDNNFESEVLESKVPVLVDFSAVWCGPCVRQLPIIEKFATENLNSIKVCKVDIDESPSITSKFGIKSVPSILLFNNGEKLDTKVGVTSFALLHSMLLENIIG
jgi:thioredoxin 1